MKNKIENLIYKLEQENVKRKENLTINKLSKNGVRRANHKYNYTCEIIQQLKNCL